MAELIVCDMPPRGDSGDKHLARPARGGSGPRTVPIIPGCESLWNWPGSCSQPGQPAGLDDYGNLLEKLANAAPAALIAVPILAEEIRHAAPAGPRRGMMKWC
ncbi:MAG: hypothetical protein R3C12_25205 [Planctomycetaceae bacterium]